MSTIHSQCISFYLLSPGAIVKYSKTSSAQKALDKIIIIKGKNVSLFLFCDVLAPCMHLSTDKNTKVHLQTKEVTTSVCHSWLLTLRRWEKVANNRWPHLLPPFTSTSPSTSTTPSISTAFRLSHAHHQLSCHLQRHCPGMLPHTCLHAPPPHPTPPKPLQCLACTLCV